MTLRSFHRCLAALALAASAALILPATAQARPESIRWRHPDPGSVSGFEAHVRAPDGSASQIIGLPPTSPDASGVYSGVIEVGDGDKIISLRAIGSSGQRSVWTTPPQLREGDPAPTPPPPPAPEPEPEPEPNPGGGANPVGSGTPLAPTPGAALRFDFTSDSVGADVAWWTDFRANFSLQSDDTLFDVVALGTNRVLHTDSNADNIHSHAMGTNQVWSDYEVRGRMAFDDSDASIGVTSYSQFGADDAYYRLGRQAGGAFEIEARPATLSCSNTTAPVTPQPGDWYRFKFDVQDMGTSNQIRAKVWREGNTEPGGYSLNCVDSTSQRPRSGRIGVWSAGDGEKFWDDLEVVVGDGGGTPGGSGGTPAPPPPPPVLLQIVPVAP